MAIHLQIIKYEVLKTHVEYQLLATDSHLQQAWSFKTRYSQIRALHQQLGLNCRLAFPPRRLFGNTKPTFVEERLQHLQQYFDELPPQALDSAEFKAFCSPEDRVLVLAARHALQAKEVGASRLKKHLEELQHIADEVSSKFACWQCAALRSDSDSTRDRRSSVEEVQISAYPNALPQTAVPTALGSLDEHREWIQAKFNSLIALSSGEATTRCVTSLEPKSPI